MKVKIKFEPRDLWIGVYWNYVEFAGVGKGGLFIYICIIPMFPIIFHFVDA